MSLIIGILLNNWGKALTAALFVAALSWGGFERADAKHWKAEAATAKANLKTRLDADAAQEKTNEADAKAKSAADEQIANQLKSALDAHRLTGDALTASVQQYESEKRRCAVPSGAPAVPGGGHNGGGSTATRAGRIDQELAIIPADAQAVIDQLRACQATLKEQSNGGPNAIPSPAPKK